MVGADARIAHRPRRLRGPTPILGHRVFLAVLVFVGVPGAFAACSPGVFADRTALKTAVDNCLAVDPTGVACCNHGADCGAAGTCLLYTSPSPRDMRRSRMPSSA